MSAMTRGGSPTVVQHSRNAAVPPGARTPVKVAPAKSKTSPKASQQQTLALNDSAAIQSIRRANLHVLTTRNGSKVQLGAIMGLTGSNMAHRLHGKKRMDDAEANRFTKRLGLPTGWLDTPRSEAEIPDSVSRLLLPSPRGQASLQKQKPPGAAAERNAEAKVDIGNVHAALARASTADDESPHVPTEGAIEGTIVVSQQDHASGFPAEPTRLSFGENDASLRAALEPLPAAAVPQLQPTPRPVTSVTSLESLEGIEPIAEALIKTLAGKARAGRLDELNALELLQQAVLL